MPPCRWHTCQPRKPPFGPQPGEHISELWHDTLRDQVRDQCRTQHGGVPHAGVTARVIHTHGVSHHGSTTAGRRSVPPRVHHCCASFSTTAVHHRTTAVHHRTTAVHYGCTPQDHGCTPRVLRLYTTVLRLYTTAVHHGCTPFHPLCVQPNSLNVAKMATFPAKTVDFVTKCGHMAPISVLASNGTLKNTKSILLSGHPCICVCTP